MPEKNHILENKNLRVTVNGADLAAHVTLKGTGFTFRMAGAQPDDVLLKSSGTEVWKSFADGEITIEKAEKTELVASVPGCGLELKIELDGPDVVFTVSPVDTAGDLKARDVLYPRHFLLPRSEDGYAVFPFGQGNIFPSDRNWDFHHREGYSEAVMHWVGGFSGNTGFIAIAETPHDLYQAVDESHGYPASCFIHWTGSLGELRYPRVARYHFEKGLDYVRQAKHYREWTRKLGWFKSLKEKVEENPNVEQLRGSPIITVPISIRRVRSFDYQLQTFSHAADLVEQFSRRTGISGGVVHVDGWGYWGYDAMHPDFLPPNPDAGGVTGLSDMARRVKDMGFLFGLHDQYIDFYTHAPSFDESKSIVTEDGRPVRVNRWAGGLCGHLSYGFIPDFIRRNYYEGVRRVYPIYHNSPSIWEICAPTASYIDCFNRTVEDWSPDHPMTREECRRLQNEIIGLVRGGRDGKKVVQSVEHPRDFALPVLDFGWSIGHMMNDVPTTTGEMQTASLGIPVPLWHLCFHDAIALPHPSDDFALQLLYAQAPYFMLGFRKKFSKKDAAKYGTEVKKRVLALHADAGFSEMTEHKILTTDGSVQLSVFGGLEVLVNKNSGLYSVSGGRAATDGLVPIRSKVTRSKK